MEEKLNKKNILIVEDEIILRRILKNKFESEGFNIIQAENGKEGLRVSLNKHPDLILLDIVMPVMDGMTMLKKLREDEWGRDAKVLLLTNLDDTETVKKSTKVNVNDYLVKTSWKIDDLIKKVKEKLE